MSIVDKEVVKLNESERTYFFPCGDAVILRDVRELIVSSSGNHRLKTADGYKHIVPQGWYHIKIKSDEWVV